ncbi:hypothetical protein N2152v2_000696 [Parachlorella kessleri]
MAAVQPLSDAAYTAVNQECGFFMYRASSLVVCLAENYAKLAAELGNPHSQLFAKHVAPAAAAFAKAAEQGKTGQPPVEAWSYLWNTVMQRYARQFLGVLAGMYDDERGLAEVRTILHAAGIFCLPDCPCCEAGMPKLSVEERVEHRTYALGFLVRPEVVAELKAAAQLCNPDGSLRLAPPLGKVVYVDLEGEGQHQRLRVRYAPRGGCTLGRHCDALYDATLGMASASSNPCELSLYKGKH